MTIGKWNKKKKYNGFGTNMADVWDEEKVNISDPVNCIRGKNILKVIGLVLIVVLVVTASLFGVQFFRWQQARQWSFEEVEEPKYISETTKEDCKLCGEGQGTLIPAYKGEANLGIISLNTFEIAHVGINEYAEFGRLKREPSNGGMMMLNTGDNGFNSIVHLDPNRGYASGEVSMNRDIVLDLEKAATHLCTNCLNLAVDNVWVDDPYGVGLINFETGAIRMFSENSRGFTFGDYYVSCEARPEYGEEDISEINFLIFYCPDRYE